MIGFHGHRPLLALLAGWCDDSCLGFDMLLADQDAKHAETIEALFPRQAFSPSSSDEIVQKTGIPPGAVEKTLRILCEHQKLIVVGEGFFVHAETVERYARPLLDYFDRVDLILDPRNWTTTLSRIPGRIGPVFGRTRWERSGDGSRWP